MVRVVPLAFLLVLGLLAGSGIAEEDAGSGSARKTPVPDVRGLDARDAVRVLLDQGFRPGRLFERARSDGWVLGAVMQQAPGPDEPGRPSRRVRGSLVHLRVAAVADGDAEGREVPAAWLARPVEPAPSLPPARVETVTSGAIDPTPRPAAAVPVARRAPLPLQAAVGSPDGSPVPPLEGLLLVEAEQLCRARDLTLYVERVPGHPVGRILAQEPGPGSAPPADRLLRVRVAAGGDESAALAPPPSVAVTRLAVPDLLDRTWPQAERILGELGFRARREEATHGPPDRVADQEPPPGAPRERGATVLVRVAGPRATPPVGERPAPGSGEAPRLIAPAPGAGLGSAPTTLLGFAWHPVPGADAYVFEVEEATPQGWVGILRQVVRRPGGLVEVTRVSDPPGRVRWRAAVVRQGRTAGVSAWVELR